MAILNCAGELTAKHTHRIVARYIPFMGTVIGFSGYCFDCKSWKKSP